MVSAAICVAVSAPDCVASSAEKLVAEIDWICVPAKAEMAVVWMAAACALIVKARWLEIRTFADLQIQVLGGAFVLITAAYLTARYLKKSGTLVAD